MEGAVEVDHRHYYHYQRQKRGLGSSDKSRLCMLVQLWTWMVKRVREVVGMMMMMTMRDARGVLVGADGVVQYDFSSHRAIQRMYISIHPTALLKTLTLALEVGPSYSLALFPPPALELLGVCNPNLSASSISFLVLFLLLSVGRTHSAPALLHIAHTGARLSHLAFLPRQRRQARKRACCCCCCWGLDVDESFGPRRGPGPILASREVGSGSGMDEDGVVGLAEGEAIGMSFDDASAWCCGWGWSWSILLG